MPLALAALAAGCEAPAEEFAYVTTLGDDTVAVERFSVRGSEITGQVVARDPVARWGRYELGLDEEGRIRSMWAEWVHSAEREGATRDTGRVSLTVTDGTAEVELQGMRSSGPIQVPTTDGTIRATVNPGTVTLPESGFLWSSAALLRQAAMQLERSGAESYEVPVLMPGSEATFPTLIQRLEPGHLGLDFFGDRVHVRLDEAMELSSASGRETTMKFEMERVAALPVEALAEDYLAREERGEGLGVLSPAATALGSIGGVVVQVSYSRPAKRGREVWGALVPYGAVWRTGANAATQITTDGDLVIGEWELPAGSYTLWSTFTEATRSLIVNSQTGIWGTAHDPAFDIAEIPMVRMELPDVTERFTIEIGGGEEAGELRLLWDRTGFAVPIRVPGQLGRSP